MSRIVIFGITNLNFENLTDPSVKVYLVGTDYDYEDSEAVISIPDKNILDFYTDENLEESELPTIFIDCTGASNNYLDVMYRLKTSRFDKRTYLVGPSLETNEVLDVGSIKFEEHFNPFDGDEIPKKLSSEEKNYLLNFFKNCSTIIYYYLMCGFDKKEINDIPPGWTLNVANKEINSLCRYYGLWTAAPDVNPVLDYSQNAQYRQIVLESLISVTSNFVIRNKIINIAEVENWNDPEVWKMIWETKFP
jgi:hypothetical protein